MRLSTYALAALLLVPSTRAAAQLHAGDRVRMRSTGMTLAEGIYLGDDSVHYLVLTGETDTTRVLHADPSIIERFVGRAPNGFKPLLKGVLAGLGAGVGLAVLDHFNGGASQGDGDAFAPLIVGAVTIVGTVVGAVYGLLDHDVWEVVP